MALERLADWQRYIEGQISTLFAVPIVLADWGVESSPAPGWIPVTFRTVFPGTPGVVAIQGPRRQTPRTQSLTPPTLSAPRLTPPTLAGLTIATPAPPVSWGDEWKNIVIANCAATIGNIPVIGGFICQGVDATFGNLAKLLGDGLQRLYYLFDLRAALDAVAEEVRFKITSDWNDGIAKMQAGINASFDEINRGLASTTRIAQDAVNRVYDFLNATIGLFSGLSIPVVQQRNPTARGVELYSPGEDTPIYWLAVYSGKR